MYAYRILIYFNVNAYVQCIRKNLIIKIAFTLFQITCRIKFVIFVYINFVGVFSFNFFFIIMNACYEISYIAVIFFKLNRWVNYYKKSILIMINLRSIRLIFTLDYYSSFTQLNIKLIFFPFQFPDFLLLFFKSENRRINYYNEQKFMKL